MFVLIADTELSNTELRNYLIAIGCIVVSIIIAFFSKKFVRFSTRRLNVEDHVIGIFSKILMILTVSVGIFCALKILGVSIGPLLGTIGVGGVALAFALQNMVMNFLGSILIHARRPFQPGDQIHSSGHSGTVIDINTRTVVLLTFDGTYVHVPNTKLMEEPFVNMTRESNRRSQLDIQVAYGTDLQNALRLASATTRACDGIVDEMLVDAMVTAFMDSGINIRIRFWHPSEQLEANIAVNNVALALYDAFNDHEIEIPLPHRVVYHKPLETVQTL